MKPCVQNYFTFTRLRIAALVVGLFVLAACGGGGGGGVASETIDVCTTNPFALECGDVGATARTDAIDACRGAIETGQTCNENIPPEVLTCLTDPFGVDCTTLIFRATESVTIETIQAARVSYCKGLDADNLESATLCGTAIANTCDNKRAELVTEDLCAGDAYNSARESFIADCTDADTTNDVGCVPSIVVDYCNDNPFSPNAGCLANNDYDDERDTACLDDLTASSSLCPGLVVTYCEANPFDTADDCMVADYDDERDTACLDDLTANASLCPGLVVTYCEANPFDPADDCEDGAYDDDRDTACLANPTTADNNTPGRCVELVKSFCADETSSNGANPFDAGCVNATGNLNTRVRLCSAGNGHGSCGNVIATNCPDGWWRTECGMSYCDRGRA